MSVVENREYHASQLTTELRHCEAENPINENSPISDAEAIHLKHSQEKMDCFGVAERGAKMHRIFRLAMTEFYRHILN